MRQIRKFLIISCLMVSVQQISSMDEFIEVIDTVMAGTEEDRALVMINDNVGGVFVNIGPIWLNGAMSYRDVNAAVQEFLNHAVFRIVGNDRLFNLESDDLIDLARLREDPILFIN